ncbi:MAG: hypothetical protein KGH57_01265 [Candidatus Micrarchaeota archaeon]|nr:hypothetical protein [Candidatus Micrarchaeota archaeon]
MDQMSKLYGYMAWRGIATVVIIALFLIASLLFIGFYASGYSLFQKLVVLIVVLVSAGTLVSILWMVWMRQGMRQFKGQMWKKWPKNKDWQ